MLQLLYPCSRYSPDRCLICGGTFRDHLTLWWSKNLYTPLDRILDDTFRDGVRVVDHDDSGASVVEPRRKVRRRRQPSSKARRDATRHMSRAPSQWIEYAFHRRYVVEVPEKLGRSGAKGKNIRVLVPRSEACDHGEDEPLEQANHRRSTTPTSRRSLRRADDDRRSGTSPDMSSSTSSMLMLRDKYVVQMPRPATAELRNTSALVLLARAFTLMALDNLLELEESDEARAFQQQRQLRL